MKLMVIWGFLFSNAWQEIQIYHVKMGDSLLWQNAKQFEECCSILLNFNGMSS